MLMRSATTLHTVRPVMLLYSAMVRAISDASFKPQSAENKKRIPKYCTTVGGISIPPIQDGNEHPSNILHSDFSCEFGVAVAVSSL